MEVASPSRRCPAIANRAAVFEGSPNKTKDPALLSVAERKALFEKNKGEAVLPKANFATKKYPAPKPPVETSTGIASKMAALLENKTTIAQTQIENGVKEQRQKEMDQLLNRFHKNKDAVESDEEDPTETTAMITTEKSVKIVKPPPMPPVPPQSKRLSELTRFVRVYRQPNKFVYR